MLYLFANNEKNFFTEMSELFVELFDYFNDTYFSPEVPVLENFSFGTGTLISLRMILIGFTFGLILASFITIYNKRYIGGFVRKLLSEECFSHGSAKTLSELGYINNPIIRFSLRTGSPLSRWARCVEEDEFYAKMEKNREEFEKEHCDDKKPPKFKEVEFKRDVKTMHFYILEDKKHTADIKFDEKGANWISFIVVVIVSVALCAFLSYTLPDLIKMIDNFISVVKS